MDSPHLGRADFEAALRSAAGELDSRRSKLATLEGARTVIIYSYGSKGVELGIMLRDKGVECLVYDNSEASRARARTDGYEVVQTLDLDLPLIVAAGQNQIPICASLKRDAFNLVESLYALDLYQGYGPARDNSSSILRHLDSLFEVYGLLDATSAALFLEILQYRASLSLGHLTRQRPVGEMWHPPVEGLAIRSFCDIGAYDGDSLASVKTVYPQMSRSFTVEPNPEMAGAIAAVAAKNGIANRNFVGAAWSHPARLSARRLSNGMLVIRESDQGTIAADALDTQLGGEQYDYIKMDVEGTERAVLDGGKTSLRSASCIAVAAYHLPDDFTDIRTQLGEILGPLDGAGPGGWRLAFSHYSQVFDDSIFYAWRRGQ
jgi:FkbM family methyltransferase